MKIRVNEYNLESKKLAEDYDILAISDIHTNINALRCIRELLTSKTEYLAVVGDTLNHIESSKKEEIIEELRFISTYVKVLISRGNHDNVLYHKNGMEKLEIPTNDLSFFEVLKNETDCLVMTDYVETHNLNQKSSVSSINMPTVWYQEGENREEFHQMLSKNLIRLDEDKFNILLSHTPNSLIKDNQLLRSSELSNIDLILSGHNHGGLTPMFIQNMSKNHTGVVGPYCRIGQPNAFGYWTTDDTSLILSNGITKIATSSELSLVPSIMNKIFIPDVELIHMKPSDKHNLQLQKRKIYNIK